MKPRRIPGQALVEFALVGPMMLILLCCVIEFGWAYYQLHHLNNCARTVARVLADQTDGANWLSVARRTVTQTCGPAQLSRDPTIAVTSVNWNANPVTLGAAVPNTDRTPGNLLTAYVNAQYMTFTGLIDLTKFGLPSVLRANYTFLINTNGTSSPTNN